MLRRHAKDVRAIWAPSLARRVIRHRMVRLAAVLITVSIAGVALSGQTRSLQRQQAAWGNTVEVLVVVEAVAIGDSLFGAVEHQTLPEAMIPPGAATELGEAAFARSQLHPGEVLLDARVTGSPGDVLPAGTAAITVAVHGEAPLVQAGDLVDLWTVDSANLSSRRVAQRVLVLERGDHDISVAVPASAIAAVTVAALRQFIVTLLA